jgi:hypothetical protein
MAQVSVKIGIDSDKSSLADVKADLTAHGLTVTQSIPSISTIYGNADSGKLEELSQVHGVQSVRPQAQYQLPPVREDIPQ